MTRPFKILSILDHLQSLKEQQITSLQQQLAALQQQHSLEQYYHQRLFQTLGAEFVIAIKHIAHLEVAFYLKTFFFLPQATTQINQL
jgi:hypothetical protein